VCFKPTVLAAFINQQSAHRLTISVA